MSLHDISSSTKKHETCQILKQDDEKGTGKNCGEKMERETEVGLRLQNRYWTEATELK